MKKLLIIVALLSIVNISTGQAYTIFFDVDDTVILPDLHGFQFDVIGIDPASITLTQGDAVPTIAPFTHPWLIEKTQTGIYGFDQDFGENPLSPETVLVMEATTEFQLTYFILSNSNVPSGAYTHQFFVNLEGTTYTLSAEPNEVPGPAVPIPATFPLLLGGLLGLFRIRRTGFLTARHAFSDYTCTTSRSLSGRH